jgi:hypothetical protein
MIELRLGNRIAWKEDGTLHVGHEVVTYWHEVIPWGEHRLLCWRDGDSMPTIIETARIVPDATITSSLTR